MTTVPPIAAERTGITFSGGGIRFFWHLGAFRALTRLGWRPDVLTGVSAGGLVVAWMKAHEPKDPADWPTVAADACDRLVDLVPGPRTLVSKRWVFDLLWRVVRDRWAGVVDTVPLAVLLRRELGSAFPRPGGVIARVACVNLRTAQLDYHGAEEPDFLDAVLASAAEPITMPLRRVRGDWCTDGGPVEIAPLAECIRQGATRVAVCVTQPERLPEDTGSWGQVTRQADRILTIATQGIVESDLTTCLRINRMVAAGLAPDKRIVHPTVVRPVTGIGGTVDRFTRTDLELMVAAGDAAASRAMTGGYLPSLDVPPDEAPVGDPV